MILQKVKIFDEAIGHAPGFAREAYHQSHSIHIEGAASRTQTRFAAHSAGGLTQTLFVHVAETTEAAAPMQGKALRQCSTVRRPRLRPSAWLTNPLSGDDEIVRL
jgi:hypothetical protein